MQGGEGCIPSLLSFNLKLLKGSDLMAITANFGTYTGNPKKILKTVTFGEAITISAWEEIDDLTCDFILDGAGYHGANYMKVDWNGTEKFYFIESRTGMTGTRTKIRAVCDVLYTYRTTIISSPAVLNRTSYGSSGLTFPFLKDNKVTTLAQTEFSSNRLASNIISDTEYVYVGVLQKVASKAITP